MDNIQLCYIDNEINKIDKMKQGDVIYKNGMELLVVLSYDHEEPCRGCFFYKDKKCGSERLIKCWNCNKEYIFTVIRENDTTELDKMIKRHKEAYEKMLNITKRIERECQKYVIWDTVHVMLKDDGEFIIKALSKDKTVLLNDFIIYVNNAVSERHINGIGYGSLLPTVQTQGLKVCDKDGKTRFMDLSSLPKQGIKYGDLLPTPVASDHTGSCTIRKMTKSNGAPRTDSLRNMPAVIGMDGDRLNGRVFQLSPLFVEEMMGYPLMWTTLPFLTGNGEKNQ